MVKNITELTQELKQLKTELENLNSIIENDGRLYENLRIIKCLKMRIVELQAAVDFLKKRAVKITAQLHRLKQLICLRILLSYIFAN